ncbi:MAG: hypothetical protein M3Q39_09295 [Actinomycetota bacterium]|nr:hypothetical protein [Actinomycetota bacterium]
MNDHDQTMSILQELNDISNATGEFVTGVLEDSLTYEEQITFALRLVGLAERIKERADQTPVLVIEGDLIDGGSGYALPAGTGDACHPDPAQGR